MNKTSNDMWYEINEKVTAINDEKHRINELGYRDHFDSYWETLTKCFNKLILVNSYLLNVNDTDNAGRFYNE